MHAPDLNPDLGQRWRLVSPTAGREVVVEAAPGVRYVDRGRREPMIVTGQLLPLMPSPSRLAWTEQNLRFCPSCDQLVPKDLNFCPYDGRPLPPLARRSSRAPEEEAP